MIASKRYKIMSPVNRQIGLIPIAVIRVLTKHFSKQTNKAHF